MYDLVCQRSHICTKRRHPTTHGLSFLQEKKTLVFWKMLVIFIFWSFIIQIRLLSVYVWLEQEKLLTSFYYFSQNHIYVVAIIEFLIDIYYEVVYWWIENINIHFKRKKICDACKWYSPNMMCQGIMGKPMFHIV